MQYIALHFFVSFIFICSVDLCIGFLRSSLVLLLLTGTGFSVNLLTSNTESCDEDDDVGVCVVEELVDKPGTTNGTQFEKLQSILLPFVGEMWFLTAGPVYIYS